MNAYSRRWNRALALIAIIAISTTQNAAAGEPRLELTPLIEERFPEASTTIEQQPIVDATLPMTQYIAKRPHRLRGGRISRLLAPHPMGRAKVTLPVKEWETPSPTEVERLIALGFPSAEPRYRIREEQQLAFFGFSR